MKNMVLFTDVFRKSRCLVFKILLIVCTLNHPELIQLLGYQCEKPSIPIIKGNYISPIIGEI